MNFSKNRKKMCVLFIFVFGLLFFPISCMAANKVGLVDCSGVTKISEADAEYNRKWKLYIASLNTKDGDVQLYPFANRNYLVFSTEDVRPIANGRYGFFGANQDLVWNEASSGMCPLECNYVWLDFDWEAFNGDWDLVRFDRFMCTGVASPTRTYYMDDTYVAYYDKSVVNYYYMSGDSGRFGWWQNNQEKDIFADSDEDPNIDVQQMFVRRYFNSGYSLWWELDGLKANIEKEGYLKDGNVLFDEDDTERYVKAWINEKGENAFSNKLLQLEKDYSAVLNQCKQIISNPDNVQFSSSTYNNIIDSIEKAIPLIESTSDVSDGSVGIEELVSIYIQEKLTESNAGNLFVSFPDAFDAVVSRHIKRLLAKEGYNVNANITSAEKEKADQLRKTFLNCSEVMYNQLLNGKLDIDGSHNGKLQSIYDDLSSIKFEPKPVEGCGDLIPAAFIDKLNEYFNIIKIIVPIVIIVMGTLDFAKALLNSDSDDLKKAQAKLIKRLIIAAIIFLFPILINFIMDMANDVWGVFSGDTCGIG